MNEIDGNLKRRNRHWWEGRFIIRALKTKNPPRISERILVYLYTCFYSILFNNECINEQNNGKDDTVITEYLKVMRTNVLHQELDGKDGYDKCDNHTG